MSFTIFASLRLFQRSVSMVGNFILNMLSLSLYPLLHLSTGSFEEKPSAAMPVPLPCLHCSNLRWHPSMYVHQEFWTNFPFDISGMGSLPDFLWPKLSVLILRATFPEVKATQKWSFMGWDNSTSFCCCGGMNRKGFHDQTHLWNSLLLVPSEKWDG